MKGNIPRCVVFPTDQLLPASWRNEAGTGPVRAFNPGLVTDGDRWILASRIVLPDGRRRISACRLDENLNVIAGSAVPISDHVRFHASAALPEIVTQWFADPRLYRMGDRLFVYWNSGWHEPRNWQFLQELDPRTLLPVGPPRELVLQGERQKLEKNWTLFQAPESGRWLALYSISPHRILEFSLEGDGEIGFEEIARVPWSLASYPRSHGGLRGGAPPVFAEGKHWVFCHSVHDGVDGYRYAPAVYCFGAQPPFAPTAQPARPLDLGSPLRSQRAFPRLNPAVSEVVYPCGAAHVSGHWVVSVGLNDERCGIAVLTEGDVAATLMPVALSQD